MVPFSGTALSGIFRLFDIDVPPYITTAAHRGAGWLAACWTSDGPIFDWERFSKKRARHLLANQHSRTGFEAISG